MHTGAVIHTREDRPGEEACVGPGCRLGIWTRNAGVPGVVPGECSRRLHIFPCLVWKHTAGGDQNEVSTSWSRGMGPDGLGLRVYFKTSDRFSVSVVERTHQAGTKEQSPSGATLHDLVP